MSVGVAAGIIAAVLLAVFVGPQALAALTLAIEDTCFLLWGRKQFVSQNAPRSDAASIVIPNWNGRDLLQKFLPSVVAAAAGHPGNEILVVDNASTDGSVEFLREQFPQVRILALSSNHGFGGGSNLGFQAAKNDVVVLLNNDMRVEADFLAPLLVPFSSDPLVFSVSCQIFFSDPGCRREETGLTETWWERGGLRVSHRADPHITSPFPCAYPGGGSSAFDRRKFLELGGFDDLLRPFYYEDTDLGHMAWKRGWKLLYQPASVVFHEHRGTIGKRFSPAFIDRVLKKNVILYCWKNIHDWRMLLPHLLRFRSVPGMWRAFWQLPQAARARWRAHCLAAVSDREAFLRQKGGYYRDRFETRGTAVPERLHVLFAAPYPIEPPVHGGAVFMKQTIQALALEADVHVVGFIDTESQAESQANLSYICASTTFLVRNHWPPRNPSTLIPHAVREFRDRDFEWLIHRIIYLEKVDVVQLDYTVLGQYRGDFRHIPCFLFEHDIFFQSLWRGMKIAGKKPVGLLEYARMLRHELAMVRRFTRLQVCSRENADYLLEFAPELKGKIDSDLRAAINTSCYPFVTTGRERDTILFVGSFRHAPNVEAMNWFTEAVFPKVLQLLPEATLVIVGADAPEPLKHLNEHPNIRMLGFVDDVREPLLKCKVFLCPVLAGSGIRVKLLEAFACGIPAVSTAIGAEGLANREPQVCEIADTPEEFAQAVVKLLSDDVYAGRLAAQARQMVEEEKDSRVVTARLAAMYRRETTRLRNATAPLG